MKKSKVLFAVVISAAVMMSAASCSVVDRMSYGGCTSHSYSRDYYDSDDRYYRGSFTDAYGNYYAGGYYEGYFDVDGYYHENYN